eukprot:3940262-Rhodomonas_salina.1
MLLRDRGQRAVRLGATRRLYPGHVPYLLRACYALPVLIWRIVKVPTPHYAMSGTDQAKGGTAYARATPCPRTTAYTLATPCPVPSLGTPYGPAAPCPVLSSGKVLPGRTARAGTWELRGRRKGL